MPCGFSGSRSATGMSRVIVLHAPDPSARVSVACHVPAAGAATSANQKYGGPPWRSLDLTATLPSGAISASSPLIGFSAAKITRSGAPFQGAIGAGKTATSAAASQLADSLACAFVEISAENAPGTNNKAVAAAAKRLFAI